MTTKYSIGDEVQSISDPSRVGAIVDIGHLHAGIQYYRVNFGNRDRSMVPEIDLCLFVSSDEPAENLKVGALGGYQEFQRLITYQRVIRESPLKNNIYAFNASKTRFLPYQFKPLLKFLDSASHRLLIADEVGLGKTIEAGLILTELRARQEMRSVLVVCPSNLRDKWELELRRRFGEDFRLLKSRDLVKWLREYEEAPEQRVLDGIISLESIRRDSVLDILEAVAPAFDLVIVDEAHHMRNFGRKQRRAGVLLARSAQAMLFLTATPIHLGSENLFSLLNILDGEEFPDLGTVDIRFQNNAPVVKAQVCMGQYPPNIDQAIELLDQCSESPWFKKNPLCTEVQQSLEEMAEKEEDEDEYRSLLIRIQRDLAELNLIGHIFTRTRKRDVQDHVAERHAFAIPLTFTEEEQDFYQAVTDYVRARSLERADSPVTEQWILHMPQRQMASSIPAMVAHYNRKLGNGKDQDCEDLETPEDYEHGSGHKRSESAEAYERLRLIVSQWPDDGPDTKFDKFLKILMTIQEEEGPSKVIVFAFFKATLNYLAVKLRENGIKCAILHGDVPANERPGVIEQFEKDPKLNVLLSSRVGSEGLDFQFCNTLFNYDLPWNPMEVEQRIGRLDRIGQQSPVIRIYNFWIEGTIEQRILQRLYERIDIFRRSIGELEMILGDEIKILERDILSRKLTPEEEEERIGRAVYIVENRLKDLKKLENEAARFIGTDHYFDEEIRQIRDRRRYVTGEQLRRFLIDFIRLHCPGTRLEYDSGDEVYSLFPDDQFRSFMYRFRESPSLARYLTPSRSGIEVTFDSEVAFEKPAVEFINILHPIIQAIVQEYGESELVHSNVHHVFLKTDRIDPGFYFYFIFRLKIRAARGSNTLEMILLDEALNMACSEEDTEFFLGEMVENGEDPRGLPIEIDPSTIVDAHNEALTIFLEKVSRLRKQLERGNAAFVELRLESLEQFYRKNIDKQQELLLRGEVGRKQERYLRMIRGTIVRLEKELAEKRKALGKQREIEENYDEIAAGVLEVIAP